LFAKFSHATWWQKGR